jgi:hypothetical protein
MSPGRGYCAFAGALRCSIAAARISSSDSGDYVLQVDPFAAGVVIGRNAMPVISNNNVNNLSGTASVEKDLGRMLMLLSEPVNQTDYDDSLQRGRCRAAEAELRRALIYGDFDIVDLTETPSIAPTVPIFIPGIGSSNPCVSPSSPNGC